MHVPWTHVFLPYSFFTYQNLFNQGCIPMNATVNKTIIVPNCVLNRRLALHYPLAPAGGPLFASHLLCKWSRTIFSQGGSLSSSILLVPRWYTGLWWFFTTHSSGQPLGRPPVHSSIQGPHCFPFQLFYTKLFLIFQHFSYPLETKSVLF